MTAIEWRVLCAFICGVIVGGLILQVAMFTLGWPAFVALLVASVIVMFYTFIRWMRLEVVE